MCPARYVRSRPFAVPSSAPTANTLAMAANTTKMKMAVRLESWMPASRCASLGSALTMTYHVIASALTL